MQMREKVGKSRNTVFFQWFEAPEGRKVGSLKRRVRSQLARWEMKKRTPLWREAHNFQVKMYKTPQPRMSEKCPPLWREAHFQVKMYKTSQPRTTFGSWDVEKVHAVVARSTFRSENVQNTICPRHFWRFRCRFAWQAQRIVHLVKSEQNVRVLQHFQKRHLKRICKDAFSVACAVQKTCSWEMLGGQGAHFLRGVAFWSIRSVGLLRWFCVTGAALRMTWHQFFVAGAIL